MFTPTNASHKLRSRIEDVDTPRLERGVEMPAEDVLDAGDHELHESLRGKDGVETGAKTFLDFTEKQKS